MCEALENMKNKAVNEKLVAIISNMLKNGDSIERIATLLEITVEEVKELANKVSKQN